MSQNKLIWSDKIDQGISVVFVQSNLGLSLVMMQVNIWCEAHQKPCESFSFGISTQDKIGDIRDMYPMPIPYDIP